MTTLLILMIPFLGTVLGAATVFFRKQTLPERIEKALLGFASGVMIAASVWSLLIPAIELSACPAHPVFTVLPVLVGFFAGVGLLLLMDRVIPHLHVAAEKPEGLTAHLSRTAMMLFAVTLHNVPEGMAVGVACAGAFSAEEITVAAAIALSTGISVQNFPEGAIVSLPLCGEGMPKRKAFLIGVISGAVEPLAGALTLLFASVLVPLMPYLLAFAAGAMIYVVAEELIPEAHGGDASENARSDVGTLGVVIGFAAMMVLDVVLG